MKRSTNFHIAILAAIVLSSFLLLSLSFASSVGAARPVFPDIVPLPKGFQPEGIAIGRGTDFFVGSIVTGAIYAGDLRTGQGEILVFPQEGGQAIGLWVDPRTNFLFVAGGFAGTAYVYDAATGAELAVYQLADPMAVPPPLINDVVVTREAAYFTDSFRDFMYRVPLGPGGSLPDQAAVQELPLGGDFVLVPQMPGELIVNANGIDATPNGKMLLIVSSVLGKLYRVDPNTGNATEVDLGLGSEPLPSADGIVLRGRMLYVVQNFINQIAVVQLDPGLASGTVVEYITSPNFRIPTTASDFGNALYAVNARFDVAPPIGPPHPDVEFEVVRVQINGSSKAPGLNHARSVTTMWGVIKTSAR